MRSPAWHHQKKKDRVALVMAVARVCDRYSPTDQYSGKISGPERHSTVKRTEFDGVPRDATIVVEDVSDDGAEGGDLGASFW